MRKRLEIANIRRMQKIIKKKEMESFDKENTNHLVFVKELAQMNDTKYKYQEVRENSTYMEEERNQNLLMKNLFSICSQIWEQNLCFGILFLKCNFNLEITILRENLVLVYLELTFYYIVY